MKSQFAGNFDLERDGDACGKALLGRQAVAGLITFVASPPHVILYIYLLLPYDHIKSVGKEMLMMMITR